MSRLDLSIDRITRSRRNLFTSVRLDRLAEYRDDPEWVASALRSDAAQLVPLWRNRSLLTHTEGVQQAVYLEPGELDLVDPIQPPTLLGTDGKRYFFAVSINDRQRDAVLAPSTRMHASSTCASPRSIWTPSTPGCWPMPRPCTTGNTGTLSAALAAAPNRLESAGHKLVCSNEECGRQSFPRIDPAIIVLVTHGNACLLGRNASWPPRRFSTLAGFRRAGREPRGRCRARSVRGVGRSPARHPLRVVPALAVPGLGHVWLLRRGRQPRLPSHRMKWRKCGGSRRRSSNRPLPQMKCVCLRRCRSPSG